MPTAARDSMAGGRGLRLRRRGGARGVCGLRRARRREQAAWGAPSGRSDRAVLRAVSPVPAVSGDSDLQPGPVRRGSAWRPSAPLGETKEHGADGRGAQASGSGTNAAGTPLPVCGRLRDAPSGAVTPGRGRLCPGTCQRHRLAGQGSAASPAPLWAWLWAWLCRQHSLARGGGRR